MNTTPQASVNVNTIKTSGAAIGSSDASAANLPPAGDGEIKDLYAMMAADEKTQAQNPPAQETPTPAPTQPQDDGVELPETQTEEVAEEKVEEQQPQTPQSEEKAEKCGRPARKLDGLDDAEKKLFRAMSGEAYDRFYPLYLKIKEAGGEEKLFEQLKNHQKSLDEHKNARFYDHPEAYTLSEDYAKQNQMVGMIRRVATHWEDQLSNLEEGKAVTLLIPKEGGGLTYGEAFVPDETQRGRLRAQILAQMQETRMDLGQAETELKSLSKSYKQRYTDYEGRINTEYNKVFGKVLDKLKPEIEKELQRWPDFDRNNPKTRLAATAIAYARAVTSMLGAKKQQAAVESAKNAASASAGPTKESLQVNTPASNKAAPKEADIMKQLIGLGA